MFIKVKTFSCSLAVGHGPIRHNFYPENNKEILAVCFKCLLGITSHINPE